MFLCRRFATSVLIVSALSSHAIADEACEAFVSSAVHAAFDHVEDQSRQDAFSSIQSTVETNVDDRRLAHFTLGRFARTTAESQLDLYRTALTQYLSAVLLEYLDGAEQLTVEVSRTVDRSARDCVAETIIHQDGEEDRLLLWRVLRDAGNLHIVDVATKEDGNTIWLSIELRAQFVDLLHRNDGQVDALISELQARHSSP